MKHVMLLIDGDNVSADVVEQAVAMLLAQYSALHLRRAWGTAESAVKNQALYRRLGIRPMVNLASGKNSTDIALAVDAIDLALSERPDVVAIASSDSDFAPLVARLREKGCRVVGFGQQGKTADDTQSVYDDYTVLAHRKAPARKAAAALPVPAAVPLVAAKPARAPAQSASAKPRLSADVQVIVDALPALADGGFIQLNKLAEALRARQLLGKTASSAKLLRRWPAHFELAPEVKPERVRLLP